MRSNKKDTGKYTIGPCGEIYNNRPALSEKTRNFLELMALKDAMDEALVEIDDDENKGDNENGDKGTTEEGN